MEYHVLNNRGGGMHHSLLSLATGDFTHFHLHKKWMPRLSPNGGVRGFQMTGALCNKRFNSEKSWMLNYFKWKNLSFSCIKLSLPHIRCSLLFCVDSRAILRPFCQYSEISTRLYPLKRSKGCTLITSGAKHHPTIWSPFTSRSPQSQ